MIRIPLDLVSYNNQAVQDFTRTSVPLIVTPGGGGGAL